MSTTNDRTGRSPHHRYADYFVGTAGELDAHDGFRLRPNPATGRTVPIDLDRPLVATHVSHLDGLVAVELIDRSSMVHTALGNLPDGAVEIALVLVMDATERVLIRF